MISFDDFFTGIQGTALEPFSDALKAALDQHFFPRPHGDLDSWQLALQQLPAIQASTFNLDQDCIKIGASDDCNGSDRQHISDTFKLLHPWRKGPFNVLGIHIDTEWRSDWKWARVEPHISSLTGRHVLDVGSGNGYYSLRMAAQNPTLVVGVDPSQKFLMQFRYVKHYLPDSVPVHYLPLKGEDLPARMQCFDTAFSMGVLYHRRSPFDHLEELRHCLRIGGELVLETLTIEGDERQILVPESRYAKMPNVWFLPSDAALLQWLERTGFGNARVVDVSHTNSDEQRATEWMQFQSLPDYLDPHNPQLTIEGYPAPRRTVIIAERIR